MLDHDFAELRHRCDVGVVRDVGPDLARVRAEPIEAAARGRARFACVSERGERR